MQTRVQTTRPVYFTGFPSIKMTRDAQSWLVVEFHTNSGPLTFTARIVREAGYGLSLEGASDLVKSMQTEH